MASSGPAEVGSHPQRKFLRRKVDVRVRISAEQNAPDVVHGRCTIIGEGGFGAVLTAEIPDSGYFWAEFRTPVLNEELKVRVNIRQRRGFQYGFQFVSLTREQRTQVMKIFSQGLG